MKQAILTSTFMRFRDRLRHVAFGIVGNSDDAEDALHDAFCRLWSRHPDIADETSALKLSFTAVRNSAIDTLRRSKSLSEAASEASLLNGGDDGDEDSSLQTYSAVLALSKRALKPLQYEIFRLHDVEGIPYPEVAEKMGLTQEHVRVTLSRARKTIRDLYRKQSEY
ncbi:MAG: sigma-70 family RNA polymerase sigma factor [Clostridium sp.]|nr:sigma-70 family RNA polymerase sigma factor [Clostridium sp.]